MVEQLTFAPSNNIENTLRFLRDSCPPDGYLISFSGGKDSLAVLEACKEARVPYRYYMKITTVDPPELTKYVKRCHPECVRLPPPKGMSMYQMIEKKGVPNRWARWCCAEFKEYVATHERGSHLLIGVRAAESAARKERATLVKHCESTAGYKIYPIVWWSDEDVWNFIRSRGVEYCELYDQGSKRIGCIGCPMAPHNMPDDFHRWPWSYMKYRIAMQRFLENRRTAGVGFPAAWPDWMAARAYMKQLEDEGATAEQLKTLDVVYREEALKWQDAQDPEYLMRRVMAWWLECPVDYWKLEQLEDYAKSRAVKRQAEQAGKEQP